MNAHSVARVIGGAALAVLMGGCLAPVGYPAYPVATGETYYHNGVVAVPAPVAAYPVVVPVPVPVPVVSYPIYRPYVAPPVYRPPAVYNPNFTVPKVVIPYKAPSFRR